MVTCRQNRDCALRRCASSIRRLHALGRRNFSSKRHTATTPSSTRFSWRAARNCASASPSISRCRPSRCKAARLRSGARRCAHRWTGGRRFFCWARRSCELIRTRPFNDARWPNEFALLALLVGPALDVALEHAVLEALLFVDRLGNVMERDDAEQRRAFLHRNITLVPLDHGAAQLHHIEMRSRDQRIAHVDLADLEIAELTLALRQCLQHLRECQHARHLPVVHHHQRADVVLRHHLDRLENGAVGRRGKQGIALDSQDFADQHRLLLARARAMPYGCRLLPELRRMQPAYLYRIRGSHKPISGNTYSSASAIN